MIQDMSERCYYALLYCFFVMECALADERFSFISLDIELGLRFIINSLIYVQRRYFLWMPIKKV